LWHQQLWMMLHCCRLQASSLSLQGLIIAGRVWKLGSYDVACHHCVVCNNI
jgi:hypothetical protein